MKICIVKGFKIPLSHALRYEEGEAEQGRHKDCREMRFITILSRNDVSNGRGSVRADLYLSRRVGGLGPRPFKLLIKAGRDRLTSILAGCLHTAHSPL